MKLYQAMIWGHGSDKLDQRVRVLAENLSEAMEKLESEYGEGNIFYLHNEDDAARRR